MPSLPSNLGREAIRALVVTVAAVVTLTALPGLALALPGEVPDSVLMVQGNTNKVKVRAIAQVGDNVWVGGTFTQVQQKNGNVVGNVVNLAVFDAADGSFKNIAIDLPGNEVWAMDTYGNNLVIAGNFNGPGTSKNLVIVNGNTGAVVRWFNTPVTKAVLAAPDLGRIYAGAVSLTAFDIDNGNKLWTKTPVTINASLRGHKTPPGYRGLSRDGNVIWAACQCDTAGGSPSKALIKLDTDGNRLPFTLQQTQDTAWGIAVHVTPGALYLAAGGNDFLASYSKTGERNWFRDTSGSTQAITEMDGQLVIGGHFVLVADTGQTNCGWRPGNLRPENCTERKYLAAYTFSGDLVPGWSPAVSGKYNGTWALHVDGGKLHVGGEFTKVEGQKALNYARLS